MVGGKRGRKWRVGKVIELRKVCHLLLLFSLTLVGQPASDGAAVRLRIAGVEKLLEQLP